MGGCDLLLEGWAHAVTNCTVEGGTLGVYALDVRQLTMTDCIVRDNHGAPWVGVTLAGAGFPTPTLTMVNCVVEDNSSQPAGWWRANCGITVFDGVYGGAFSLQDCTIRNNLAISPVDDSVGFAGITRWVLGSDPSLGSATFEGTTVCGNLLDGESGVQVHGDWTDGGGNTIEDECAADCPADINGDGVVNGADLTLLLGDWGAMESVADLDNSGTVDGADLTVLLGDWGEC